MNQQIINALNLIPPDLTREDWLKVTTSLKSAGNEYKTAWEEWTQRGSKFKTGDLEVWDSCKDLKVNIGTLFHYAKSYGYTYKKSKPKSYTSPAIWAYKNNTTNLNQLCLDYFSKRGIEKFYLPTTMIQVDEVY